MNSNDIKRVTDFCNERALDFTKTEGGELAVKFPIFLTFKADMSADEFIKSVYNSITELYECNIATIPDEWERVKKEVFKMKMNENKIYVCGLNEDGTESDNKLEQVSNMFMTAQDRGYNTKADNEEDFEFEYSSLYGEVAEEVQNMEVTELFKYMRNKIVAGLKEQIAILESLEPTTKEEWQHLTAEWDKE